MISAKVITDRDVFEAALENVADAPRQLKQAYAREVAREGSTVLKELRTLPERSPLPFRWSDNPAKQAKARRWYFANKVPKGSKGGRYNRTGKMAKAFKVRANLTDADGVLTLENDTPGAVYVYGARQVPSHKATGYPQIDELAFKASERLTNRLIDTWFTVSAPKGKR